MITRLIFKFIWLNISKYSMWKQYFCKKKGAYPFELHVLNNISLCNWQCPYAFSWVSLLRSELRLQYSSIPVFQQYKTLQYKCPICSVLFICRTVFIGISSDWSPEIAIILLVVHKLWSLWAIVQIQPCKLICPGIMTIKWFFVICDKAECSMNRTENLLCSCFKMKHSIYEEILITYRYHIDDLLK